jgi:hypothetical protein
MDIAQLRYQAAVYFNKARDLGLTPEGDAARMTAQGYLQRARDLEEVDRHLLKKL